MPQNDSNDGVLDWDDLSKPDQLKAEELLRELNALFSKYSDPKAREEACDDSTSGE